MIIKSIAVASNLFSIRKNGGRLHWLQIINPTVGEDVFLHLFDKQNRNGTITDYNATVAGTCLLTIESGIGMGHGLGNAGDAVTGVEVLSINHSGAKTVTIVDANSFYFTDTYVADDAIIFWSGAITLGTTASKLSILCRGVDADGFAGGFVGMIDGVFEQGVLGAITTTLDGSAGLPTNRGSAIISGGGLDDCTAGGVYTGLGAKTYRVQIDGTGTPDTFKWSNDGGVTWEATTVAITGSAQTLENGITVTFGATTGHTDTNYWDIAVANNHVTSIFEEK